MSRHLGAASWPSLLLVLLVLDSSRPAVLAGSNKVFPITTGDQQQQQQHGGSNNSRGGGSAVAALEAAANETYGQADDEAASEILDCDLARMRCAYRDGCNRALSTYFESCASQLHDNIHYCPKACHYALVGLMSTDEGKDMMNCKCLENDVFCTRSRRQAEICRSSVETVLNSERVSCRAATSICNADTLCGVAYDFYYGHCRRMFLGKKCTKRCMNSINILQRQEKAAKLNECYCDGPDDHECLDIHRNMKELCFDRANNRHKSKTKNPPSTTDDTSATNGGVFNIGGRESSTIYGGGWPVHKDPSQPAQPDLTDTTIIHRLPPSVISSRGSSSITSWRLSYLLLGSLLLPLLVALRPQAD